MNRNTFLYSFRLVHSLILSVTLKGSYIIFQIRQKGLDTKFRSCKQNSSQDTSDCKIHACSSNVLWFFLSEAPLLLLKEDIKTQ